MFPDVAPPYCTHLCPNLRGPKLPALERDPLGAGRISQPRSGIAPNDQISSPEGTATLVTPVTDLYDFGVKFRGKKNRVAQKFRSPARLLRRVVGPWIMVVSSGCGTNKIKSRAETASPFHPRIFWQKWSWIGPSPEKLTNNPKVSAKYGAFSQNAVFCYLQMWLLFARQGVILLFVFHTHFRLRSSFYNIFFRGPATQATFSLLSRSNL